MRNAETVLGIIHERGRQGLPLEDVYRQLFNPNLFLLAYGRIYHNKGAMTSGATDETVDGMSVTKINAIIEQLRYERYRWTPVRRVYIEKKNSHKRRPLGIPTWSDKLLQEVMRLILEAYYEPQFSPKSHGFRPKRGCQTALTEIYSKWVGTKWFIEGDIAQCFDSLDHSVLLKLLREKIHDNRFLRLIENLLQAGYLEQWRYNATLSGSPQGAVLSPILSNIYLNKLDQFVENKLIPKYTRGQPIHRAELIHDSVFSIVARYQQEFRGIVEYYRLAFNLHQLNRLKWVMGRSLAQTLAHKLRISVRTVYRRYQTTLQTDSGPRTGLQVMVERGQGQKPLVAKWGGISLSRNMKVILNDSPLTIIGPRTELERRLLADTCELCGSHSDIQVHHVRALKDLQKKGRIPPPYWVQIMAARQRKTLVVCRQCHMDIHAGRIKQRTPTDVKTLESRVLLKA